MSGQIIDATLVPRPSSATQMPRRRRSRPAGAPTRSGLTSRTRRPEGYGRTLDAKDRWQDPLRQGRQALPQIALPVFGYKSHIAIDRRFGFIRECATTSASHADGRMLPRLVAPDNTSSEIFADSAYRSQRNEKWLASKMLVSRIHRRKPAGKPMPPNIAGPTPPSPRSALRSSMSSPIRRNRFGLFIRTFGIARAEAKLTLANIAYNFDRLIFHERACATG